MACECIGDVTGAIWPTDSRSSDQIPLKTCLAIHARGYVTLFCDRRHSFVDSRLAQSEGQREQLRLIRCSAKVPIDTRKRGYAVMKSPAVKSLAVVVAVLAAMTWAKARSPTNLADDGRQIQVAARAVTS